MGFFGGKIFKGALASAGIGGTLGLMNTGDFGGFAGGAAAGLAFGGFGIPYAMKLGGHTADIARSGLGFGIKQAKKARRGLFNYAAKSAPDSLGFKAGFKGGAAALGSGYMMADARRFIGQKALSVNKWGGVGLAALGFGASSYIGSSILGSNQGY